MYYEERDFKDKNKFCIEDFDRKIKRHFDVKVSDSDEYDNKYTPIEKIKRIYESIFK